MPYANNKGADQPAPPRSLISTFVVRCLDSIVPLVSISEISSLYLASVAVQAGLCLTRSQTPKTGFLVTRLISCHCRNRTSAQLGYHSNSDFQVYPMYSPPMTLPGHQSLTPLVVMTVVMSFRFCNGMECIPCS